MITSLKKLILEVKEKSQSSTLELLQNPAEVLTRCENQDVNYSLEDLTVKTVCRLPMMKEMLKRFQVAVNLAEDTAHSKLVFSQEGRYVKNGASTSSWPLFFYSMELRYRMAKSAEDRRLCGAISAFTLRFGEKCFHFRETLLGS